MVGLAFSLRKAPRVVENETFVAKGFDHHREVVGRRQPRSLAPRAVVEAVRRVERQREHAAGSPLEATPVAGRVFDLRRTVTGKYVKYFFVKMPLRRGR